MRTLLTTGHLPELFRPENAADAEFSWTTTYGTALRIKGAFGVCCLSSLAI